MDEHADVRWWSGVNDPIHPLARGAHIAVAHGRHLYIFNGCAPDGTRFCLFDRAGVARLDILTKSVHFLPLHWDVDSIRKCGITQSLLNTSGSAATIHYAFNTPASLSDSGANVYLFAGFSLLGNIYLNALIRIRLPSTPSPGDSFFETCCQAKVISGHGLCAQLLCQPHATGGLMQATIMTLLYYLKQQLAQYPGADLRNGEIIQNRLPSPRDKLCIECWKDKLFAFGGYGPCFLPPNDWPVQFIQWPFLCSNNGTHEYWIPCENDHGWNNQLLVYDLKQSTWSLATDVGGSIPTPRAAHKSVIHPRRGWMLIFGGRGPPASAQLTDPQQAGREAGRLDDLYCLDFYTMQFTRVCTPKDDHSPLNSYELPCWPTGRSWMAMCLLSNHCSPYMSSLSGASSYAQSDQTGDSNSAIRIFMVGGFSNSSHSLSDAYVLQVAQSANHRQLQAHVIASSSSTSGLPRLTRLQFNPQTPHVVDGFHCESLLPCEADAVVTVDVCSGEYRIREPQSPNPFSSDPSATYMLRRNIMIFQRGTFTPVVESGSSLPPASPLQPFYYVARLFTDVIIFLLTNFSWVVPSADVESAQQHEGLLDAVNQTYQSVLLSLVDSNHNIAILLLRHLLRFLPSWDPVLMVLRESDTWLPAAEQSVLLSRMTSDHLSGAGCSSVRLDFSDFQQSLVDKLTLLFPLDKLRFPEPYRSGSLSNLRQGHLLSQLDQHLRQFVLSVLLLRCSKSPVKLPTDHLSTLTVSSTQFSDSEGGRLSDEPCSRFWHSVSQALDGRVYVIGGFPEMVKQIPMECYEALQPPPLTVYCYQHLARYSSNQRNKLESRQEPVPRHPKRRRRRLRLSGIEEVDKCVLSGVTSTSEPLDTERTIFHVVQLQSPVHHHLPIPVGRQLHELLSHKSEKILINWLM